MSTKKATKRALLTSILAICLCLVMLIGSTFAWFTDTASTNVNSIQSGTLDVALQMKDANGKWVSAEGKTLDFVKAEQGAGETILWEPGCTYVLPELRVVNKGNLALKYKIAISNLVGDAKLGEVIDWSYNDIAISKESGMAVSNDVTLKAGEEGTSFTIKGHMQETAGNDYMNLSIQGVAVTVYATQAHVEYDSFNNIYDAGANYTYVTGAADLKKAVDKGENVILNSTVNLTEQLTISKDITINGNGNAIISDKPVSVAADANVTIKNVSFEKPVNGNNNASNLYASGLKGKLVLDGCSFAGSQWDCVQVTPEPGAEIIINNCRFEATQSSERFVHIQAADYSNADVKVTLTNNFFGSVANLRNSMIDIDYINIDGINFGGNNTYTDVKDDGIFVCGPDMNQTISTEEAYKRLGSKLTVVNGQNELTDTINNIPAGTPTTVKLAEGTYTLPSLENKDVTISGTKDTVIDLSTAPSANGATIAMEGVTIKGQTSGNFEGLEHTEKVIYKNCTITGKQTLYANDVEFIECDFSSGSDYAIWTYGAKNVTFTKCDFTSGDNSKAVLCYSVLSNQTFTRTFNECTFTATGIADKSAIMINPTESGDNGTNTYIVNINNCTATGYAENGISGQTIVGVKETVKDNITVNINGTEVYTH